MLELGTLLVSKGSTYLDRQLMVVDLRTVEMFSITVTDGKIYVSPALSMDCPFCGRVGLVELKGKFVCGQCVKQLQKLRRTKRGRQRKITEVW